MLKVAVYMTGFYLVYFMFLSRDTLYRRNRSVLLLSIALSLILPSLTLNIGESGRISYFGKVLSEVFVTAEGTAISDASGRSETDISAILFRVYLAGFCIFGIKLLIEIVNLLFLIIRKTLRENKVIEFDGFNTAGFSAMGYIFINRSLSPEEAKEIIRHEQNHLDHYHFYDILLVEFIKVAQWFNPTIYMINRSLRAIHEYQADEGCLMSGMNIANYQSLLLNHLFRSKVFMPSSSFSNPSLIKKRMIMMTRVRTGSIASLKLILMVPVVILLLAVISSCEKNIERLISKPVAKQIVPATNEIFQITGSPAITKGPDDALPPPPPPPPSSAKSGPEVNTPENNAEEIAVSDGQIEVPPKEIFVVVEEMPGFPGGDAALMDFIYSNIEYPESAKSRGIMGRVILRFAVMADGSVDQVTVLKGVDPSLDFEAIRVIRMLPKWKPGKQGGKPVNVWYSVPVTFQLSEMP